jgi:CheY-like chemotaxis protein
MYTHPVAGSGRIHSPPTRSRHANPAMLRPRPLRVLVVDDDRDTAASTAEVLGLLGYDVRAAHDGPGALQAVDSFPPDVVLMDIGLPREDGYGLARRLCAALKRRPILVAVTGHQHIEGRSRREGFDHHLVKPVDPEELVYLLMTYTTQRGD